MSRHVQDHGAIAALSVAVPAYTETVSCVLLQSYMTCTSLCRLTQPLTGAAQEAGVLALVASAGDVRAQEAGVLALVAMPAMKMASGRRKHADGCVGGDDAAS